jgi:DNA modification methylase
LRGKKVSVIYHGDCLEVLRTLPTASVQCCVTSPPYFGLRNYGVDGQIGLEKTPHEYVAKLVDVFREVKRVLRDDGTVYLNLGDSYATGAGSARSPGGKCFGKANEAVDAGAFPQCQPNRMPLPGLKPKDLCGIPWRVAFALQADGWYLRSEIIWHKPNPMPESVTDRPTKAHEQIFLLSKNSTYYYDAEAVKEPFATDPKENSPARARITGRGQQGAASARGNDQDKSGGFPPSGIGRNRRSVWTVTTKPFKGAHFATFPPDLIEPCILAGAPRGATVLDPFAGAGTTGLVAMKHGREFIGIELNSEYVTIAEKRIKEEMGLWASLNAGS